MPGKVITVRMRRGKLRCLITGRRCRKRPTGHQAALWVFYPPVRRWCPSMLRPSVPYGRGQNEKCAGGSVGAFAYTAALNYLLSDRRHYRRIGGDTYVFWAEGAEEQYEDAFGAFLDGGSENYRRDLASVMDALGGEETMPMGQSAPESGESVFMCWGWPPMPPVFPCGSSCRTPSGCLPSG